MGVSMGWSVLLLYYSQRDYQHTVGDQLAHVDFFEFCWTRSLVLQLLRKPQWLYAVLTALIANLSFLCVTQSVKHPSGSQLLCMQLKLFTNNSSSNSHLSSKHQTQAGWPDFNNQVGHNEITSQI